MRITSKSRKTKAMFDRAFEKLEGNAAKAMLDLINPKLDRGPFPGGAQVLKYDLSFYEGYSLIQITDHMIHPPQNAAALIKEREVIILDWTNAPIYTLNENVPVKLTQDTVKEFVKFFFTYVAGRHGRFLICDGVDDVAWKDEPAPAARKAIAQMIKPVTITARDPDGTFHLRANMMFKDSLFESNIHVTPQGQVSLSGEELLVEDMPVMEDRFG